MNEPRYLTIINHKGVKVLGVFSGWVVLHGITKIHVWINSRRFSRQQTSQVIPVWFGVLSLPIYAWVVSTYLTSNNIFLSSIYFGIKVKIIQHAKHLTKIFKPCCGVSVDRLGILFKCYYKNQIVYLSMKVYINKALTKYQKPNPTQSHNSPFRHSTIQYVKRHKQFRCKTNHPSPRNAPRIYKIWWAHYCMMQYY